MKTFAIGILALALGALLSFAAVEIGERTVHADPVIVVDAGVVTADAGTAGMVVLPPAVLLPDPIEHPALALTDVQLARKTGWPLAIWAALAMFGKALAYARDKLRTWPVIGKVAAWLAEGKRAMVVAAIGAVGAAGYNVLLAGGTVTAALIASGVAIAGLTHSTTQPTTPGAGANATTVTVLALMIGATLALGTSLMGCTPTQKATAINTTILVANAGCTAYATYVDAHLEALVQTSTSAADATAKVDAFKTQAEKVRQACAAVYAAVYAAVAANDNNALAAITPAAAALQAALKAAGVGGSL